MANEAQNRLTLKVGITLDQSTATREWVRLQKEVNAMQAKLMDAQTKANKKASDSVQTVNKNLKHQKTLIQELNTGWAKTLGGFIKFSLISSAMMAVTVTLKNIAETIVELDTAMTNFNIVTKATGSEMAFVNDRAGELANTLGVLKTEIIDATTEFARAGFTISDSMLLAENSIKAANAGGVELADIVTYVIAGLKSFKLEAADSAKILDVLFSVANMTAIDLEGIGEAFLRSANTLQTAGASLEESAALIAAANETIQDPAKVGTALKTIASRLRGVGEEGEIIPTLANDFKRIGIEIQNADGSFRDIYSIFSDFADVYKTLDDLTKQSLIEKIAGKRQANILIGLVENFDLADKSLQTALDSAGEIETANDKIMSSVGKQIDVLTNSFKAFYAALSTPESLATLVHVLTAIVDGLTLLIENLDKVLIAFGSTLIGLYAVTSGFTGLGVSIGILTGIAAPWMYIIGGIAVALGSYSLITSEAKQKTDELADSTEKLTEKQRENQQVVESGNLKAQKKLADELQKQIDIIDDLIDNYDDLAEVTPDKTMFGSNLGIVEFATDLNAANMAISEAEKQLENMGYTVDEARAYIESLNVQTKDLTQAQLDMAEANFQVKQITSGMSDEYQVLSDALEQLEIDGYLTDDMLNTLIETYPDLVSVTGLQTDAVRAYLEMDKAAREQILRNTKSNMVDKIREAQVVVDSYRVQINALRAWATANGGSYGVGIGLSKMEGEITNAEAIIKDASNNIALLDNELAQLSATDIKRNANVQKSAEEKSEATEKEIELLSESERALKAVNQQIALQQKLYARTEDADEQIKINLGLIELYKKQKTAIEKVRDEYLAANKSIKKTDEGYDEYIDTLYDFALQIEDATNNMYNLTQTNEDLAKSIKETNDEIARNKLDDLSDDISDAIDDEIDKLKELQKAKDDAFDKSIKDTENQIDGLNKTNEALEDQIKLQELLDNLQELRERKANIEGNKNVRLVNDSGVGFEWVADPRELRAVNEEIKDAQTEIDNFNRNLAQKAEIDSLEAKKENIEEEQRIMNESYDQEIEDWEDFKSELDELIEKGGIITSEKISEIMANLGTIEKDSYVLRLLEVVAFVNNYNAILKTMGGSSAMDFDSMYTPNTGVNFDSMYNSGTGGTSTTVPTATNLGSNISNNTTNANKQTNIGNINVVSPAKSVDALLNDINSKAKVYEPKMTLY